jgi:hypothetical protein
MTTDRSDMSANVLYTKADIRKSREPITASARVQRLKEVDGKGLLGGDEFAASCARYRCATTVYDDEMRGIPPIERAGIVQDRNVRL